MCTWYPRAVTVQRGIKLQDDEKISVAEPSCHWWLRMRNSIITNVGAGDKANGELITIWLVKT
jgi:hypothetical protein